MLGEVLLKVLPLFAHALTALLSGSKAGEMFFFF
jgi:hypothetical protein